MTDPNRFAGGVVDLGEVKARAEARAQRQSNAGPGGGGAESAGTQAVAAFFTVTEENFETEVLRRSIQVPVIVLVGSGRSDVSEQLKNDLRELAEAGGLSFLVGYLDADATPQIAQALGVRNLPTVMAIGAGRPLANFEGGQPRENLRQWLDAVIEAVGGQLQGLPPGTVQAGAIEQDTEQDAEPAEDPRLAQATEALNAGDFDAAIAVYDEMLAEDPADAEIKQARGTVELLKRLDPANRSTDALQDAEDDPDDVDKQLAGADAEVVAGVPEQAFTRLLETMKRTTGEEKTRVKDRLLELFGLFEPADPRVREARTKLASALF